MLCKLKTTFKSGKRKVGENFLNSTIVIIWFCFEHKNLDFLKTKILKSLDMIKFTMRVSP